MPQLYDGKYSAEDLRQMTGSMAQIAGIRLSELADGKPRGMRVADIYTGSGFRFQVLLDRAMDIGAADYNGKPLAWTYPALGTPEQFDPHGYGWGRTFGGGLVTTCGLTHFGQPEQDGPEALGLHGRISHIPAGAIAIRQEWQGDEYLLEIRGETRQAALAAENLLLTRTIRTRLGATSFSIEDTVRNDGFRPTPHMILYHCNFGFPVVSPESELLLADELTNPRDAAARAGLAGHRHFDRPEPEFAEQVFFHKPRVGADGWAQAGIANRALAFGAFVRYDAGALPYLAQWKMMAAGDYVCALEPANQWETPRHKLREEGRLRFLAAGEEVHYHVELGVLPDAAAVGAFEAALVHTPQPTG
jgi:Domain of unknown function (DUF4432)